MKTMFTELAEKILMNVGIRPDILKSTVYGLNRYYTVDRYYHNQDHIVYMIDRMEEAGWNNDTLEYAILFHDVFYLIGVPKGYNERASSNIAIKIFRECALHMDVAKEIDKLIMITAEFGETLDLDKNSKLAMMADLDLSSLARIDYKEFILQQRSVMMEHGSIDLSRSAAFLKGLLEKRGDDIYYTNYAKENWLDQAKENINRFVSEYGS